MFTEFKKIIFFLTFLLIGMVIFAQAPDFYPPTVPEKIEINIFNIILYIVLPIGLVAVYFWYQRSQKKKHSNKIDKMIENGNKTKKDQ